MTSWEGRANSTPSFIEAEGSFITKPTDIVNYFNDHFIGKVCRLRQEMPIPHSEPSYSSIQGKITKDKNCSFEFCKVTKEEVQKLLLSV